MSQSKLIQAAPQSQVRAQRAPQVGLRPRRESHVLNRENHTLDDTLRAVLDGCAENKTVFVIHARAPTPPTHVESESFPLTGKSVSLRTLRPRRWNG